MGSPLHLKEGFRSSASALHPTHEHQKEKGGTPFPLSNHPLFSSSRSPYFFRALSKRQGGVATGKFFRRKKELSADQLNEIQDSFDLFQRDDKDSTGGESRVDAEDLLVVMRALGHEPNMIELKKMVTEVDRDNTGQLDFDGYLNIILNKMAERPSQGDLEKAFRLFDPAGKRAVDFHDLKRIAGQIGEQIADDELMDMIRLADNSKGENGEPKGEVNQEDFFKIVTSYAQHYDGEK